MEPPISSSPEAFLLGEGKASCCNKKKLQKVISELDRCVGMAIILESYIALLVIRTTQMYI